MSELRLFEVLRRVVTDLKNNGTPYSIVGGIAVSTRADPRFTRDVDLAIAVETDAAAERVIHSLVARQYDICAVVEQEGAGRLSTARLKHPDYPNIFIDLLFASCGIESEIVAAAEETTVSETSTMTNMP